LVARERRIRLRAWASDHPRECRVPPRAWALAAIMIAGMKDVAGIKIDRLSIFSAAWFSP